MCGKSSHGYLGFPGFGLRLLAGLAFILIIPLLLQCSGAASDPMPVSLPVPFTGALTGTTNVEISEGIPIQNSQSFLKSLSAKNQSRGLTPGPTTWKLFEATTGVSDGSITFNSMTDPELSAGPAGGVKRVYTMDVCAAFSSDREACSSNFKCFDLPTDFTPPEELVQFASSIAGSTPEVRKMYCSGNINRKKGDIQIGELLDGKFVIGSACLAGDATCFFHTQIESAVAIHGTSFSPGEGNPEGNVVTSLISQGGSLPVADNPFDFQIDIVAPGTLQTTGVVRIHPTGFQELAPDGMALVTTGDAEFQMVDGSRLLVHNVVVVCFRLPELDEIVRNNLQMNFADAPGVTPRLLQEGVLYFNTTGDSHSDPINCDPAAGEATGQFQELCQQFPRLHVAFRCTSAGLTDPTAIDGFMFLSFWEFIRD